MKYYIIAGEASGDLHGAHLMQALYRKDPSAEIRFWGGDQMLKQGGVMVKHFKDHAFMGFWEVLIHLPIILRNIAFCKADILAFQPDILIYVDYPGFNMRIAKWAKNKGYLNHFYISPQIWAWKENRIKKIKRDIDQLYVILPFEKDYFENKHNYTVKYVGHPLVEVVRESLTHTAEIDPINLKNKPIIALLPGSRKQEINKMMPVFLSVVAHFPKYQFVIAGAPGIDPSWYDRFTIHPSISLLHNQTYTLLKRSYIALVTSGTATLETALFNVPQLVCYRSSYLSYFIAKQIISLKYISLVNLIMDKEIVRELIQHDCTTNAISEEIKRLSDDKTRKKIALEYRELSKKLGSQNASETVASSIVKAIG